MKKPGDRPGRSTEAIHTANVDDRSAVPIYTGATNQGMYSRDRNPTVEVLENAVARLERGEIAIATASGMSAVSHTLFPLLRQGARVVRHRTVYVSTGELLTRVLPRFGVEDVPLDLGDPAAVEKALAAPADLVYAETVSNPTLEVIDLAAVAERAHRAGAMLVVDNTFATPYFCRPLELGADVVVHSATKYLSGHGDALAGVAVCKSREVADRIRDARSVHGAVLSPYHASLVLRGLKTLPLRMAAHAARAAGLAEFLRAQPKVAYVRYPGLPEDSAHVVAAKQMDGFGGMVGFAVAGGQEAADAVAGGLKLAKVCPSLGDVQTLVTVTRAWAPLGIPGAYLRVSVGLEDVEDILADFDQALASV